MGYYCTVPQCTSLAGKTKNVKFHRFPRDVTMADKWNQILKRGKPYTKYSKVCSLHFTQADYNVTTMGQWKTLSKDAVPSQNLPRLNPDGTVMVIRKSRTVKYREGRKDSIGEKCDKWSSPLNHSMSHNGALANSHSVADHDPNAAYRLQTLSAIASAMPPQLPLPTQPAMKPKKQDAFMQTDPIQSEDEDLSQPNNSYSEASDTSYNSEQLDYQKDYINQYKDKEYQSYHKEKDYVNFKDENDKKYADPKVYTKSEDYSIKTDSYTPKPESYTPKPESYTPKPESYTPKPESYTPKPQNYAKQDDYIPQTNEEYNKEAEKYALERKSLNGYDKHLIDYQKHDYQKMAVDNGYQMVPEYMGYPSYTDSVETLRNQQHNLEMLQQQHRVNENQNFFNENHIKQEIDINSEEEKFLYERAKDQLDANAMYAGHRSAHQQRLLDHLQHQVKQEPDVTGCENVMQPQGSPYYAPNGHTNGTGGYYDQRPGPELLIAKQNALAAHTQLWQNTMKRPFFYSETPHYSPLHRYEDLTRILQ